MRRQSSFADQDWLTGTAELVFAAGLDPSRWLELPARFVERFPGAKAIIVACDNRAPASIGMLHAGVDCAKMTQYEEYYAEQNPWTPFWKRAATMRVYASDVAMPSSRFERTEFYNDWLCPMKAQSAVGAKIFDEADRMAMLALHYKPELANRYNRALLAVVSGIAPALRAAIALNRYVACDAAVFAKMGQVLDMLALPALVVDRCGTLRYVNALGRDALDRRILFRGRNGRIHPSDEGTGARFDAAIASLCVGGSDGTDIALRAPGGGVTAVLTLLPVSTETLNAPNLAWLFAPERLALVIVRERTDEGGSPQTEILRRAFGLTDAESRLAARIATGATLESTADALGVSKETARSQLKQVFVKTDTHRQAELVALLARLSGPRGRR